MIPTELDALRRINIFATTVYVKHWFESPNAADVPLNDLGLMKTLQTYQETVDKPIAEAAMNKLSKRLWYFSENLVCLAFFSDAADDSEKLTMIEALKKPARKKDLQRAKCKATSVDAIMLSDFVTKRSLNLFQVLHTEQSPVDLAFA